MDSVQDILARKGTAVIAMAPNATVLQAARIMNERGVGSVLVMWDDRLVGVFTERDVLRRVVAEQRDPATTPLYEVMTVAVLTCQPGTGLLECGTLMSENRVRHLPVLDDEGAVRGIVTSGDLLAFQLADQQSTIAHLNRYVFDVR